MSNSQADQNPESVSRRAALKAGTIGAAAAGFSAAGITPATALSPEYPTRQLQFEDNFFANEVNRFGGSGAELLVKGDSARNAPSGRVDVGDYFIGLGITHVVESLSRPPGPDAFRSLAVDTPDAEAKMALRAIQVAGKEDSPNGVEPSLAPLAPDELSHILETVSDGAVQIPVETIPEGTMVISFRDSDPVFTIDNFVVAGSQLGSCH